MTNEIVKYPIGIQDFESLRRGGYVYVDKTEVVFRLISSGKYFFLSRPRRFGKSLFLSTLKAFFEGKKELFEGLAIGHLETEWKKRPVLHLELSRTNRFDYESLHDIISQQLQAWENLYGIKAYYSSPAVRFGSVIRRVSELTGESVVILIDEYDNPLINTLRDQELHEKNKELLKSLYSNLKYLDCCIHFAMLTGVSRFTKTSVFSGLNNLRDITFENEFADICGITNDELISYFSKGIESIATEQGNSREQTLSQLKSHYDGYHFSAKSPDIYNPFSLLNAFAKKEIGDYWFSSATPEFLVRELRQEGKNLQETFNSHAQESTLRETDSDTLSTQALLFQAGYLTIKGYEPRFRRYKLGIPNREVEEGLDRLLLRDFLYPDIERGNSFVFRMVNDIEEGRPEEFLTTLKTFFAGVPFDMSKGSREVYFHNSFYILCSLIGLFVKAENHTSQGSIDLQIETEKFIYIIELKLDHSSEEALRQIEEKGYVLGYKQDGRRVFKIGVNFSSETRNISDWKILEQD